MTSLLLIILTDRERNNWVLATLSFILGLWLHSIQWEWGNLRSTYKLPGVGIFLLILPIGAELTGNAEYDCYLLAVVEGEEEN